MLIVNGNNGQCLDTVNVTINPSPSTPTFTSNPSSAQCSGTPITFAVSNQQSNVIYSWDFGDGTNGTGATISHTYNSVGNGTVSYNVIVTATFNGTGCSKSATATVIQVKQKPDASMVDINNTIQFTSCGGSNLSISVVNTSVVNSNNYRIQWGDGTPDYNSATFTTSPPGVSHNYIGLGYFNVVLTVTNTNGCSSQTRYSAYNGSNPQGGISNPGGTTGLCSPANINFPINNVSANTPGTIYILTPSDGSLPDTFQHPPPLFYSHTFNISSCGFTSPQFANSFYVQLRAVNQCDASGGLAEQITINSKPKVNFTISPDTIVCKNTTVSLTNTSDNGASVQSNLCDSTGIYNWIITPNSGYTIISGQLGSNPPIVALPSTWGSRNLQISFTVPGTYSITLKGRNKSNCGGDSIIKTICVQSPPTPSFIATPLTGCSPLVVNFTDNSSGTNQCGKITRLWTVTQTGSTCIQDSINDFAFSSGTNSASLNPVIRFNNQGTYTVTLSLTNKCGTFDTIQTFTVKRKPEVALSGIPPFLCAGLSITPTATYAPCLGTISTYAWSFPGGNPSSSISQTPGTITYPSAGNYSVSLAVTNECGTTTVSASITIQNAPVAVAGNDKLYCSGGNAQIGGASTGGNTYSWSPATGLSSTTVSNPTVTLAANGTTTVTQNYTVTVTNQAGCSATDTVIVTVYPPATVNAGPSVSMCNINTITLAGSFGGGASSVTWTSTNGGNFSNASSPTSTYTPSISSGIIILTLTTDDPTGPCSAASDSLVFTIFQTPTPNAGNDQSYCSGGSASIGSANVVGNTYSWSPSIGLSSTTVSNPIVTLAANGTTTVTQTYTVTATNQAGCSATDAVTVIVYPPATVNAGPSVTICNVNSTILAGTFGGGATGIVWTSNNGGTFSNLNSTISTFTPTITSGNANLTICTNDPSGPCPSVCDSMIVTVVQPPQANAGNDQPICSGGTVQVGVVPQSGYTYSWTPAGSVSNTTISNPTVTLTNNGTTLITQTLTLIVSATGCADTDQVVISVYPPAIANAGAATSVCYGDSVQLNGAISGAATSATWTSPNGTFTNASVLNTYFHPTITNGNATITLTTNDPTGPCPAATSTVIFTVNPIPTVTAIPNQTVCEGSPTTLVALSSPIAGTTFSWSGTSPNGITNFPSSGATSSIPSFTPNNPNTSAGTIIYTIIPTANGCVGTPITFNFTVNPSPNITTVPPQTVCSGQSHTAVVFASNVVNTTYSWSATTTAGVSVPITNGTASIPAQIATNTGTTNGTVTYTITPTANNCPGTSTTFVVTVYPTPAVNTIQPQTFCSGGQTTLVAPSSSVGGATFTWTAIGSANTNGFTPSGSGNIPAQIINYTGVTQGTVTYTIIPTANSCPGAPLDFVVTVYPIPTVVANPILDSICSGTQTNISLSSNVAASTFSWSVNQPASVSGATAGTGNAIQQTLINTSSSAQKVTYTVTPSVNNCPGSPLVVTVWVYPGITVSFSPSHQFICSGDTSVLVNITSPTPGVAFTWTSQANGVTGVIASGINTIPVQTLSNSTSAPINVVYLITANYAGCISQNANDTITVNPIPTVTNLLSQTVCEGIATQTINFTSAVTGTNFSWSGASSNGITGFTTNGNANTIPPQKLNNPNTTLGTVIYSITPNANGCPGLPVNYTITVNPTPNIILPADTVICNGNASNPISISSSVVGTAFSWTSTSMAGVSGNTANGNGNIPAQTFSNANNNISSVTYTIIANANTCVDTAIYTISVNPSPTVVFSLPNQTICSGTSIAQVNLTSSTPNANINWTANVPSGITGATSSGTSTIAIQNLTNTTFQPLTITYTAQAVTSGITCPGTTSTYTITVNPLPDLSLTPTLDTICSASQTNIQLSSNVVGTVFTWTVNTPPNISGQSGGTGNSITQTLLSTDANPQTVTYNITTNAATCPGQSASSSVIVNPSPTVQFSLPDQIICSDFATKAVQITSPTAGAVITWTATIPASISGATASGTSTIPVQTLTNSSNVPQQVIYNASVNFSACPGLANTYTITVNPTPHITNTDTVQTICSGDLSMAIPLVSDVTGVIFSWNGMGSATLSGFQTNGTTNTIPSQPISNSSNISDTVLYMVTPTAAGCVGPPQEFQIAVNPRPLISLIFR
jgi:PKD repeat protein